MKICILTHTFPRFAKDTAAPFMFGLATGMVSAGNEVYVLSPYSSKYSWKKTDLTFKLLTYKYIWPNSLHKLGYSETLLNDMGLPILMWVLSPFMYFFGFWALLSLVRKDKIDLINAHWILPNGFIAALVSFFTGVPVVSTLPGSDVYMAKKNALFKLLAQISTKVSKKITSNSPQLISDLEKITGVDISSKSETIIYGVDPNFFKLNKGKSESLKKMLMIPNNCIVVLGIGRLVAKKGFEYLIRSSVEILKKFSNVVFVIVGDGDQREYLEKLTRKLGVQQNFIFTGSVNYQELIHYYNLADIFILPSVRDEKGNLDDQSVSVMEAMACGKPVITSNFPGYRIVINDGENGFLVNERDVKKIRETICTLVKSKVLREEMGRKGRQRITREFSWKAVGVQYSNLFSSLVK
ncbi:MAG: hypothetical protein A3D24_02450 [Candidatus Blackburnbacteria bacterium RIFCSPHIGHO2_02_FULL_39_13]|uniref:Glycosyl transferase family 1 domain-containing protein n=1 Tax=Candidatus Blackburnbacteria bacterium RIFCSPLOWO2_01_FULL_40_20 TaxID=1797519 RepID=A0A1G1VCS1_9BACT|nr:MAG: hypothetical protein UT38_C0013G0002 [Microgenomates group bacterium GW2011_GWA2_39_19]OGY06882.1 MAG: hypothetical protein A2694_03240 [Candidatus Blackburnbacteria bacterium RIFCSPHIGHO2_01_FULL_40_17]OGY08363.1 MAG: hypothetical protein A3D24_02450 [Candidatus Blackburnbacteria bacterium RIFCSPHIGHO2_02_FULL_39_13]OGY13107.1 MAG: hypothetical protein A3A77_03915 [Candidatus Blackburnbacteria bacterium RIFCSPLOWO2_01_FULL_40_20]